MTKEQADQRFDVLKALKDKYEPRIIAWLTRLSESLTKLGATCSEVIDMCSDEYKWSIDLSFVGNGTGARQNDVDLGFDFKITESMEYDGEDDNGVSFMFSGVWWGGRVFPIGLAPGNFTPDCWVDMRDAEAVERRFALIEDFDPEIIALEIHQSWLSDKTCHALRNPKRKKRGK